MSLFLKHFFHILHIDSQYFVTLNFWILEKKEYILKQKPWRFVPRVMLEFRLCECLLNCFLSFSDGELYAGVYVDFMGTDSAIFRTLGTKTAMRTDQYNSRWLNGKWPI